MSFAVDPALKAIRTLFVVLVGALLLVPTAGASGTTVIQDCVSGGDGISGKYTQSEYKSALEMLSGDGDEYSDCRDQIREAQFAAARGGGSSSGGGATPAAPSATGTVGGGTGSNAVTPSALGAALKDNGLDPSAQVATPAAPAPISVAGDRVDLASGRAPSIANALSLPLPLAASAIVVLLSAALPLARFVVARYGGPPTSGTGTPS